MSVFSLASVYSSFHKKINFADKLAAIDEGEKGSSLKTGPGNNGEGVKICMMFSMYHELS